jgi:hypothetical protein
VKLQIIANVKLNRERGLKKGRGQENLFEHSIQFFINPIYSSFITC